MGTEEPGLFMRGKRVGLRALERHDVNDRYQRWINTYEVTKYLESGLFPSTLHSLQAYYERVTGSDTCVIFAIEDLDSHEHIGNVKLEPIHWVNRTAVFGILIGEHTLYGQGIGYEASKLCIEYAFHRLDLRKISLGVLANHDRAIRLYERLGFVIEGRRRQEHLFEGTFVDSLMMSVLQAEFNAAASVTP